MRPIRAKSTVKSKLGRSQKIEKPTTFAGAGKKIMKSGEHGHDSKPKVTPYSGYARRLKNPFSYKKLYPEKIKQVRNMCCLGKPNWTKTHKPKRIIGNWFLFQNLKRNLTEN